MIDRPEARRRVQKAAAIARLLLALLVAMCLGAAAASPLAPAEARGKQIFLTGKSASGQPIEARVGRDAIAMPAAVVPCASCHGRDGLGKAEGGVTPANLTWANLTKPYGHRHAYGRQHPAFIEETLTRAVTTGIDPAGNRLDPTMPRYALSAGDAADLVAFLRHLGTEQAPGIDAATIRVGTLVPGPGPLAQTGEVMQAVMAAYFADVNAAGGVYNRRIELASAMRGATAESTVANVERLLADDAVFALVGAFASGADREMAALAEAEAVPLVVPFTLFPQDAPASGGFSFYLHPGLKQQAVALVDYAARSLGLANPGVAVVYPAAAVYQEVADAVEAEGRKLGWIRFVRMPRPPAAAGATALIAQLERERIDAIFLFGLNEDLASLIAESGRLSPAPHVFLSGQLTDRKLVSAAALPDALRGRVFLAYPALPGGEGQAGFAEFSRFRERHGLGVAHPSAQIAAYCAARIFVEGLKRAGRDLSREGLVAALEGLYQFDAGLATVTYGPNRRIGAELRVGAAGQ